MNKFSPKLSSFSNITKKPTALIIAFLTMAFGVLLLGSTPPANSMNLKAAVMYAMTHSPDLDNAKRGVTVAGLETDSSFYAFFPKATFSSSHGVNRTISDTSDDTKVSSFSIQITETLYNDGKNLSINEKAKIGQKLSELGLRSVREQLALDVATAFYDCSQSVATAELLKRQSALVEKQFNSTEKAYRQGLRKRQDYLGLKAERSRAILALETAKDSITRAENTLRKLLFITPDKAISLTEIKAKPISLSSMKHEPFRYNEHLTFKKGELEKSIGDKEVELAKKAYTPEVTLSSAATYGSSDYLGTSSSIGDNDSLSMNILLGVNYTLWDWGTVSRDIRIAKESNTTRQNNINKERLSLRLELDSLLKDIKREIKNYKLATELYQLEEQNYKISEKEYRHGRMGYFTLTTAMKNLIDARKGFNSAHFRLLKNRARYLYHKGELYDSITKN